MTIPTIEEVISLIDDDIAIFENIRSDSMKEKAAWARDALLNYEMYEIRFGRYSGEKYTFAIYNPEANQWWDITGHYHFAPPDEKIINNKRRIEKYEERNDLVVETILKVRKELGMPHQVEDINDFYDEYYDIRNKFKKKCEVCGREGGGRGGRYEWHHVDHSLRRNMVKAEQNMKDVDPLEDLDAFSKALKKYIICARKYYTDDLSQTVLLCKKCHAGVHAGKIDLSEALNGK